METVPQHVLVLGGAGYIGSACVAMLCEQGHLITVLDNLRKGQREKVDTRANFVEGSILNPTDLEIACTKFGKVDVVIHCAALKAVGEGELQPGTYFETNVTGTLRILEAMERYSVPKIIFSSTAALYRPAQTGIYTEESAIGESNVYGTSKLLAETLIREFQRTGKIRSAICFRYFNVAGDIGLNFKEKSPQNVFPILRRILNEGTQFSVFGTDYETRDGTCVRDYIHLADLVNAHMSALGSEYNGVLNLGTSKGTSVYELVRAFETVSGKKIAVATSPRRKGDSATVIADARKAETVLNWHPQKTLEDMVRSTLELS